MPQTSARVGSLRSLVRRHHSRTPCPVTTARIVVAVLGLSATVWHALAVHRMGAELEGLRRSEAPPVPRYNWGRFRYLSDPQNLQPGAEPLARRYRRLWYGFLWIPVAWAALIPWLLG